MKKFLIIGSIGLGIVFCLHAYWLSMNLNTNDSAFDHSVAVALYSAADSISEQVTVERRSPNYFFVTAKTPVSSEEIDTLIRKEFTKRKINQDYEIGIYNAADDSLIHGKYVKEPTLIPNKKINKKTDNVEKNFAVLFPAKMSSTFSQEDIWVQMMILILIVATVWLFLVNYWKTSIVQESIGQIHEKEIGNSIFDCKNQILHVKEHSFQLTHKESQLINLFFQKPDQVIPREEFLEKVWKQDGFFVARSMDVFISKIRKYLKSDPSLKIENLRSIGYRLVTQSNQIKR